MIPNNVVFIILFVKKPVISNREITFFNKVFNDKVHTHILPSPGFSCPLSMFAQNSNNLFFTPT